MTETEQRPQAAVVPVSAGHLAAAGLIAERAQDALAQLQAENEHLKSALAGDNEGVRLWMLDCARLVNRHRERGDRAEAALREAQAKIAGYENAITWNTSCTSCAATLDSSIREHERAEKAEAELAGMRERVLAGAEARKTTLTWPDADTVGKIDVVPLAALRTLLGPGAGDLAGFWLTVDGEGGEIIMSAPCADTLGCLWSHHASIERVTLGELLAAASTHTGMRAGRLHATLAPAEGEGARAAEMNDGRPVVWCSAVPPGGWVCAVPVRGHGQEGICGMPVEPEPCGEHLEGDGNG